jgi:hypothetical protein
MKDIDIVVEDYPKDQETQIDVRPEDKYSYRDMELYIKTNYSNYNFNNSAICDIIAMYLKGQKTLYTEAKTLCEQRMNFLMLPAILITSVATILSLVLKEYTFGPTIVSCLNGANAFLLALISYLKLDAKAEAHRTSAYKYSKLQSNLEFNSGKNLFVTMNDDEILRIINETEQNVKEINETNQFVLPELIRYNYPILHNINVFAELKRIQNKEMILINKLTDIMNTMEHTPNPTDHAELEEKKKQVVMEIIELKDDFMQIDDHFEEEIQKRSQMRTKCQIFGCLKT